MNPIRLIPRLKVVTLLCSLTFLACPFQTQTAFAQTLRPAASGRHIEWSNGTPLFLLSDTCWMLPPSYSQSEVSSHAATRKAQGFAALQMSAVMASLHPITQAFTSGDFARPVASYWTAVDAKVKAITDAGLIVIINPFWLKGSETALNANSDAKCLAYGRFFGTRYRNNPRVVYFLGGDAVPTRTVNNTSRLNNIGLGIQQVYAEAGLPKAIIAYHSAPQVSSRQSWPSASWLTLNWTYSYSLPLGETTPYQDNWGEWPRSPAMPIMHGEGWYDRNNGASTASRFANRHMMRRQIWWSVLSGGIGGHAYGAEPIWLHGYGGFTPAQAATWNSGLDAARVKKFLDTTQWWRLRPDINNTFLTGSNGAVGSNERAVASLADDNSFGVAYTPNARALTLRMPTGRAYTLRWYDPSSGAYRSGSVSGASGASVTMAHPGNNASGAADWIVHVSSGVTPPPPPSPPPPPGGQPANGTYKIINVNSNKCLDQIGNGTAAGSNCEQWDYLGGADQKWVVTSLGNGEYSITCSASALRLQFDAATTPAAEIATASTATIQKWKFVASANGYSITNVANGKVLDVKEFSVANGGVVQGWSNTGTTNQKWLLQAP